jgi:hypothetical protein
MILTHLQVAELRALVEKLPEQTGTDRTRKTAYLNLCDTVEFLRRAMGESHAIEIEFDAHDHAVIRHDPPRVVRIGNVDHEVEQSSIHHISTLAGMLDVSIEAGKRYRVAFTEL